MKYILVSGILVALIATIGSSQTSSSKYDDAEAYAVYSAVLFKEWPVVDAKATNLVIQLETSDYPHYGKGQSFCLVSATGEEPAYDPVIEAYKEINKTPWLLQPKFTTDISYELVSKSEILSFFATKGVEGWRDFYVKYPKSGGYNVLSAVGFNPDKTIAIVYVGHSCGGLCGGGSYHVLTKKDRIWTEIPWHGASCNWVS
jgi:hypothetical protein